MLNFRERFISEKGKACFLEEEEESGVKFHFLRLRCDPPLYLAALFRPPQEVFSGQETSLDKAEGHERFALCPHCPRIMIDNDTDIRKGRLCTE
ncbi:hypothetical protein TNCV_4428371 [Trichonephila clavipes]|nr:hypothetical protein TNCV_4428371 [Trichonephila clavipes]